MENADHELAKIALELIGRANIQGNEVAAFVAVQNWLQAMATPAPQIVPAENKESATKA